MRIAIVGNGRAGSTAARVLREKYACNVDVFSDETRFHYARTALMYVSMGAVAPSSIIAPLPDAQLREIASLDELRGYDAVVLATGSRPELPPWCTELNADVQCYTAWNDVAMLADARANKKRCVVVGGGLIGAEVAEVLHHQSVPYTWLIRGTGVADDIVPGDESAMITRHMQQSGIAMQVASDVVAMVREGGRVTGLTLHSGETLAADHVVLAMGSTPSIALAQRAGLEIATGVVVDASFRTSLPHVYAIGDCAQPPWGIRPTWHDARAHGEHVAHVIAGGADAYVPSMPSMQATFLHLEWYSVGDTSSESDSWYWRDPHNDRSVRLYHRNSHVVGVQTLGIRIAREMCEAWIAQSLNVDAVRARFADAVVDPEFTPTVVL